MIEVSIPLKTISVANARLNKFALAKMVKGQRTKTRSALANTATPPQPPLTVVLTRVAPGKLDTDNLGSSLKAVRDGVADWLHIDDGSDLVDWQYQQRKSPVYGVEVDVI